MTIDPATMIRKAMEAAGIINAGVPADVVFYQLCKLYGGQRITIPATYARTSERVRRVRELQGKCPALVIADRLDAGKSTIYRDMKKVPKRA